MTSPDLIRELRASRPAAPQSLRTRVREIASTDPAPARRGRRLSLSRPAFVLVPAAAAVVLAIGAAGVVGLTGSGDSGPVATPLRPTLHGEANSPQRTRSPGFGSDQAKAASPPLTLSGGAVGSGAALGPTSGRAEDVDATLTVRVADSTHVSSAAQDALDITRTLGGHVQSASVTTGAQAQAQLTVRIPVDKTEDAVTKLSALGTILSQQVSIQDLQEHLDSLVRRTRSVRAQIVKITARLESEQLSAERRAALELRRRNLQTELRSLRQAIRATHSTARFATVELSVVTPDSLGVVPTQSRLDRSLDKAVEILVWEGIVALVVLLVAAPLAVLAVIAWIVGRTYRRHEEDRLLATS
jgi:Domain of unknown function (DUF4349)